jgi:hypothetical protein
MLCNWWAGRPMSSPRGSFAICELRPRSPADGYRCAGPPLLGAYSVGLCMMPSSQTSSVTAERPLARTSRPSLGIVRLKKGESPSRMRRSRLSTSGCAIG